MTQGKTRLKIWLVLVGVFVLGSVTGAALSGVYQARSYGGPDGKHDNKGQAFIDKMRKELNLTNEQAAQINTIVNETRNEFRTLRAEARPRYDAIRQKKRERIRGVLNAEQQQKFDQMIARKDAARAKDELDER